MCFEDIICDWLCISFQALVGGAWRCVLSALALALKKLFGLGSHLSAPCLGRPTQADSGSEAGARPSRLPDSENKLIVKIGTLAILLSDLEMSTDSLV